MKEIKYEKSCGAVVTRIKDQKREFLIIHQVQGHWCFPKGHMEGDETEAETARREIREETGLIVSLDTGFRTSTHYSPSPGIMKEVVYFLAIPEGGKEKVQKEELQEEKWVSLEEAYGVLTFDNDADILRQAEAYLEKKQQ